MMIDVSYLWNHLVTLPLFWSNLLYAWLCISCVYPCTVAINVTKVTVDISPSDDDVIPVVLDHDGSIIEPKDLYQLSHDGKHQWPNVAVGEINTVPIVVNDDDEDGKIRIIMQTCVCNIRIV